MRRWRTAVLGTLVSASLTTEDARANDSTFGGAGSDLVPLQETRVRMISEDISLEYRQRWHITARYVFENFSDEAVSVQVGFPEYRCLDSDQDCEDAPFEHLRTEVNGAVVTHRQGKLGEQHEWTPYLGVVWLYDVTFPVGSRVPILHRYSVASGTDVMGSHHITYVTRTGAQWAGAIGHARFTYRLPATAHTISAPSGISVTSVKLVDPEGPEPYVEVVCEEAGWNPTGDLFLSFNDGTALAVERLGEEALERSGLRAEDLCPHPVDRQSATPAQEQMCVNDGYAVSGYPFQRNALQRYYYGDPFAWRQEPALWDPMQSWYVRGLRPLPGLAAWEKRTQPPKPETAPGEARAVPVAGGRKGGGGGGGSASSAGAALGGPHPSRVRPGGCGCSFASEPGARWWPLLAVVALVVRRRTLALGARSHLTHRS